MTTYYCYHESPIGPLLLAGDGESLSLLGFPKGKMRRRHEADWIESAQSFAAVRKQLDEYFAGDRDSFDLKLSPAGTDFQQKVWHALTKIPYGETWSYGQLAEHIGQPSASRAVGSANGVNPIPVIIPCHRVIGASGKLTGFGGGLETKQYLLNLEAARRSPELALA